MPRNSTSGGAVCGARVTYGDEGHGRSTPLRGAAGRRGRRRLAFVAARRGALIAAVTSGASPSARDSLGPTSKGIRMAEPGGGDSSPRRHDQQRALRAG
jgi:hypothetical protein